MDYHRKNCNAGETATEDDGSKKDKKKITYLPTNNLTFTLKFNTMKN